MAEKLEIIITADDQVSGKLKGLGDSFSNLGKKMTSVGKSMTLGITAPIVAMGTMAVLAASNMEEAANKVDVVFGDAAISVHNFAENASTSLGMSASAALEAAGTYGNLFVSMGIGEEAAADMSTELLQLAADLASFNNIDPTVALEKLRAGLTGETEPLKSLGVNLNQVAIKAKALELGLIESTVNMPKLESATIKLSRAEAAAAEVIKEYGQDSEEAREALNKVALAEQNVESIMEGKTGSMDAAAKAQAAYALILEQTTTAQGDFERTSDGLANTMRTIKASFGDIAAELGTVLLPLATQFATWLKTLLDRFQGLSPETQKMIVIFAAIAAAIGPILIIIGSLVSAIGAIIGVLSGPLIVVIAIVVAAVALLAAAWRNDWGGMRTSLIEFWEDTARPALEQLREWLQIVIPQAIAFLRGVWEDTLLPLFRMLYEFLESYVFPPLNTLRIWLAENLPAAIEVFLDVWRAFAASIEYWSGQIESVINHLREMWEADFMGIRSFVEGTFEQIQIVFDLFRAAFEGDWELFGEKLRELWENGWETMVDILVSVGKTLVTTAYNLGVSIGNAFRDIDWAQVGKDIIMGIVNGLITFSSFLYETAGDIARAIYKIFKGFFDIQSPSKLMEKVGMNIGAGVRSGLMKSLDSLKVNMQTKLPSVVGGMSLGHPAYATAGNGGDNRVININFSGPVYGDEYELERIIMPFIERGIREDKARS